MVATSKKPRIADHFFVNASNVVVDEIENATGFKYHHLKEDGDFMYQIPGAVAGSVQTMLAVKGGQNIATYVSGQAPDGVTALDHIKARFAALKDSDWGTTGPAGFTYNLDFLADAIVEALSAKGGNPNRDKIRTALDSGMAKKDGTVVDAKSYRTSMLSVDGVKDAYARLNGKAKSAEAALDEFDLE